MLGLGEGYVALPGGPSLSPSRLRRLRIEASSLRQLFSQPSRLCLLFISSVAIWFCIESVFSDINTARASSRRSSGRGTGSLPNSGWVSFDGRADAPFVPRYTDTAPPTRQELRFSPACRDLWISQAILCPELRAPWRTRSGPLANKHTFDVVYTWQNGSDQTQVEQRTAAAKDESKGDTGTDVHHFRDHDELRYSLRSLIKAFSRFPEAIGKILIYSSDFALSDLPPQPTGSTSSDRTSSAHTRIGSIPKWLDVRHPNHLFTQLQFVFPWQVFKTPAAESQEEAQQWRDEALPSFQSMSVESQFPNIDFDEYMLYSCDDFFLFNDFSPSDVYTPLFGPNFRLRPFHSTFRPVDPLEYKGERVAEGLSLTNSAFVLGKRFGMRTHRYIEHVNKVFSKPLLEEMQSCFAEDMAAAGQVKFRGRGSDINIHSLFIHYVIERHREALLWSAIVARADQDGDGHFSKEEFQAFLRQLGGSAADQLWFNVAQPRRKINTSKLLRQAGVQQPLATSFDFTSLNGYALLLSDQQSVGVHSYPNFDKPGSGRFCSIDPEWCFGGNWTHPPTSSTSDVFKRAAFEEPKCGDCVIAAFLGESSRGLEAFLPPSPQTPLQQAKKTGSQSKLKEEALLTASMESPILPLSRDWHDTDFALSKVLPRRMSSRDFATSLLLRYSYVMGGQKARLIMVHNEFEGRWQLGRIKPETSFLSLGKMFSPKTPSFVGINDDIEQDEAEINQMLHGWFNMHWPEPLDWEV